MKSNSKISTYLLLGVVTLSLSLGSCRKKEEDVVEEESTDTEQSTAEDNNTAEAYVVDIESIGSEVTEKGTLEQYKDASEEGITASACATITGYGTKIVTVDFGTGCVGNDGRTRSGKLIYDFTASTPTTAIYYRNPGFSMSVSSQNYVVDGYTVNITNKNVTNTTPATLPSGVNPGTNLTWAVNANVSIVKPNGAGTISWTCTRTKELVNTSDSACYRGQSLAIVWSKAIVKINGSASGVNAKSENYTSVATNLVRDFNCSPDVSRPRRHPFISGTIVYTPGARRVRTLDYGTGACDLSAVLTIGTKTYTINL
jgi:hypothetical protein